MDVNSKTAIAEGQDTNAQQESWLGFLWFLAKLLLAVLAFRIFVFSPFSIPSESMLPRLMTGEYLLAAKWPYGFSKYSMPFNAPLIPGRILADTPERGDVVIFKHPVDEQDYIKRVIGLPGDSVAVVNGQVVLNGKPLPQEQIEDFVAPISPNTPCTSGGDFITLDDGNLGCRFDRYRETLPSGRSYEVLDIGMEYSDTFKAKIVPEGHLFLMGDNRDDSLDSRFPAQAGLGVGIVPEANLVGRATIIVWSTDGSAEWLKPWTWFTAARWNRIGDTL